MLQRHRRLPCWPLNRRPCTLGFPSQQAIIRFDAFLLHYNFNITLFLTTCLLTYSPLFLPFARPSLPHRRPPMPLPMPILPPPLLALPYHAAAVIYDMPDKRPYQRRPAINTATNARDTAARARARALPPPPPPPFATDEDPDADDMPPLVDQPSFGLPPPPGLSLPAPPAPYAFSVFAPTSLDAAGAGTGPRTPPPPPFLPMPAWDTTTLVPFDHDHEPDADAEGAYVAYSPSTPAGDEGSDQLDFDAMYPSTPTSARARSRARSAAAQRPASYIPRPPNAFILFRAAFVRAQRVAAPSPTSANATGAAAAFGNINLESLGLGIGPGGTITVGAGEGATPLPLPTAPGARATLSKLAGAVWRALPASERAVWEDRARKAQEAHRKRYPDWRFRPENARGSADERPGGTKVKLKNNNNPSGNANVGAGSSRSDSGREKEKEREKEREKEKGKEVGKAPATITTMAATAGDKRKATTESVDMRAKTRRRANTDVVTTTGEATDAGATAVTSTAPNDLGLPAWATNGTNLGASSNAAVPRDTQFTVPMGRRSTVPTPQRQSSTEASVGSPTPVFATPTPGVEADAIHESNTDPRFATPLTSIARRSNSAPAPGSPPATAAVVPTSPHLTPAPARAAPGRSPLALNIDFATSASISNAPFSATEASPPPPSALTIASPSPTSPRAITGTLGAYSHQYAGVPGSTAINAVSGLYEFRLNEAFFAGSPGSPPPASAPQGMPAGATGFDARFEFNEVSSILKLLITTKH